MDEEARGATRPAVLSEPRAALVAFVALEALALPLLLWWGRHGWFGADDWDFLSQRTGGNLGDLFRPHGDHWVTLPILAYRLMWWAFGLRTYVPYLLLGILLHLTAAALLRVVMRRASVGPWMSTIAASLLVFFGSGVENILVAFQMTLVAAFVFGLIHLLAADHDGPIDHRDWIGLGAGVAALMCSGVAIPMTLVVGIVTLAQRGRRIAAFHTAPLAAAYLAWWLLAPAGQSVSRGHASRASDVVAFVAVGLRSAFGQLGQLPGVGVLLAVVLVVGLVVTVNGQVRNAVRGPAAVPIALLAGAIVFLFLTAISRAGRYGGFLARLTGPELARAGRYVYLVGAMALPAIAMAADALIRRWHRLTVVLGVLLLVGLPGNIHLLETYRNGSAEAAYRRRILTAARLPLAPQLPRSMPADKGILIGPELGWLIDSLPSGRIPSPGPLTRDEIATETLRLALPTTHDAVTSPCRKLTSPTIRVLGKGDRLTVDTGAIKLTYLPVGGGRSQVVRLSHTSVVARAGPLRLALVPAGRAAEPAVICTSRARR